MERLDTVIVGGGQAGLATSYYLTQQGREHVVLEQARTGRQRLAQSSAGIPSPWSRRTGR